MRTIAPPHVDARIVDRCRRNLRGWLFEVWLWLATALSHLPQALRDQSFMRAAIREIETKLARDLRFGVMVMRRMLVVAATARFRPAHPRVMPRRFLQGASAGARRMRPNRSIRRVSIGILSNMQEGALKHRAAKLKHALDRFDALVTRAVARFVKAWRNPAQGALVINAPQRDAIARLPAPAIAAADSS